MKVLSLLVLFGWLALCAGTALSAPGQAGSVSGLAIPRTDENSLIAHAELLDKARAGQIDLYFAGDSITRRWGATDYPDLLAHWNETFFGWNAANFAWGGDTTGNILWRLGTGELDGVYPKVIVLLAGTNDVGGGAPSAGDDQRAASITEGIRAILDIMREKAPRAKIILMGVLPRNDNAAVMSTIYKVNRAAARFADGDSIRYLNINDELADDEGILLDGMSDDGLHLTLRGYQVWADALRPILTELLGEPALEDHAPPPTGNPAATPRN